MYEPGSQTTECSMSLLLFFLATGGKYQPFEGRDQLFIYFKKYDKISLIDRNQIFLREEIELINKVNMIFFHLSFFRENIKKEKFIR